MISNSPESFADAVEAWHAACKQACLENGNCLDRYGAVVAALITWLADNPAAARLYFGGCDETGHPWLSAYVRSSANDLTRSIVELNAAHDQPENKTKIEFVIGALRHLVREELRRETFDHTRLAHRLTRFAPLLPGNRNCRNHW